ncbi:MAG: hypothetical protein IPH36_10120 [Saprospiraceae bacterium]|nr:hypothetical protein [Saprospiraceae bacterium]
MKRKHKKEAARVNERATLSIPCPVKMAKHNTKTADVRLIREKRNKVETLPLK